MSARLIQVIEVLTARGRGTPDDLCRTVKQYFSVDGDLLAESDPRPWTPPREKSFEELLRETAQHRRPVGEENLR